MNAFKLLSREPKPHAESTSCICPNCRFEDLRPKNFARKVGGTVGALAGAASGVTGILSAARMGMIAGAPAGPVGAVLTAVAAATLRGIVGATIGCEVGTAMGSMIDRHVLENDACRNCGFPFGTGMRGPTMSSMGGQGPGPRPPFGFGHPEDPEDLDLHDNYDPQQPPHGPDAPRYPVLL